MIEERAGRGRCAVASAPLEAGTVVSRFSGAPYACCPLPSERERWCAHCFGSAPPAPATLMRCSKCKWVRYCSRACQTGDWARHKRECPTLNAHGAQLHSLADAPVTDLILLGRCLWRRHEAADAPSAEDVAFDALEAGEVGESDRALASFAVELPGLLPKAAGGTAATAAAAARLLTCFRVNNFGVTNDLHSIIGAGCYPPAAILNHSCAPNCVLYFEGGRLDVRTCRAIAAGEELCHSYVELCQPTVLRREAIRTRYGFECKCARCSDGLCASGQDVDAAMGAAHPSIGSGGDGGECDSAVAERMARAEALLARAAAEEDEQTELALCREAVAIRREYCHRWSSLRYQAEGRCLSVALACGENEEALVCCRALVDFLEAALSHVPCHPILSLQRFTLCDLELHCGDQASALRQMQACAEAMEISHGEASSMRQAACERFAEFCHM